MSGVRASIRLVGVATILATYNLWAFTLAIGPASRIIYFPAKIVSEFEPESDRILAISHLEAGLKTATGREAVLYRNNNTESLYNGTRRFARRNGVWSIVIDHDVETVEWYFMFYYRKFIVYIYCPNENVADVKGLYEKKLGKVVVLSDKWFICYY